MPRIAPVASDVALGWLEAVEAGVPMSTLARANSTTWNRVSAAVTTAKLQRAALLAVPRPTLRGECVACTCHTRPDDFEVEPLTSLLVRKPGTCRRGMGVVGGG